MVRRRGRRKLRSKKLIESSFHVTVPCFFKIYFCKFLFPSLFQIDEGGQDEAVVFLHAVSRLITVLQWTSEIQDKI
jgi:hypothetical protein